MTVLDQIAAHIRRGGELEARKLLDQHEAALSDRERAWAWYWLAEPERALPLLPQGKDALRSRVLEQMGQPREALDALPDVEPGSYDYRRRAELLLDLDRPGEALEVATAQVAAIGRDDGSSLAVLAAALAATDDPEQAEATLSDATAADGAPPILAEAHVRLSDAWLRWGEAQRAVESAADAAELNPYDPRPWRSLLAAAKVAGDEQAAGDATWYGLRNTDYDPQLLDAAAASAWLPVARMLAHLARDRYDVDPRGAMRLARAALPALEAEASPDELARHNVDLGRIALMTLDYTTARSYFETALDLADPSIDHELASRAALALVEVLLWTGEEKRAREVVDELSRWLPTEELDGDLSRRAGIFASILAPDLSDDEAVEAVLSLLRNETDLFARASGLAWAVRRAPGSVAAAQEASALLDRLGRQGSSGALDAVILRGELGLALVRQGQSRGREHLERVVEMLSTLVPPDHPHVVRYSPATSSERVLGLLLAGDFDAAYGALDETVAPRLRGEVLTRLGRYEEALLALAGAAPGSREATDRVRLLLDLDRTAEAVAEAEESVSAAGDSAAAHVWLGRAYDRAGDAARACAAFDRAVALEPEHIDARRARGRHRARAGDFEGAVADSGIATEANPHWQLAVEHAQHLISARRATEALDHALRATRAAPAEPRAWDEVLRAHLLLEAAAEAERALQAARQAVGAHPGFDDAMWEEEIRALRSRKT